MYPKNQRDMCDQECEIGLFTEERQFNMTITVRGRKLLLIREKFERREDE
jgi:hypothetical protein